MRLDGSAGSFSFPSAPHIEYKQILHHPIISAPSLYSGLPSTSGETVSDHTEDPYGLYSSSLLPTLPNPAPEIEAVSKPSPAQLHFNSQQQHESMDFDLSEPKTTKKKYAKEAWPKKAPKNHLGDI